MAGGLSFGERFDADIRRRIESGATVHRTAEVLGLSNAFVRRRVHALGLREIARENTKAYYRDRPVMNPYGRRGAPNGSMRRACLDIAAPKQLDRFPSEVFRKLRGRSVPFTRNAIGCLHQRGLTVEELQVITGKPAAFVVSAIREAAS